MGKRQASSVLGFVARVLRRWEEKTSPAIAAPERVRIPDHTQPQVTGPSGLAVVLLVPDNPMFRRSVRRMPKPRMPEVVPQNRAMAATNVPPRKPPIVRLDDLRRTTVVRNQQAALRRLMTSHGVG